MAAGAGAKVRNAFLNMGLNLLVLSGLIYLTSHEQFPSKPLCDLTPLLLPVDNNRSVQSCVLDSVR